jgi:hypothetical protein
LVLSREKIMRALNPCLLVSIAMIAAVSASPARAGALQDLVGFGAQDVTLAPPAKTAIPTAQMESPGQNAEERKKLGRGRLPKACEKAGLGTAGECGAARKPALVKTSPTPAPVATTASPIVAAPAASAQTTTTVTVVGSPATTSTGSPLTAIAPANAAAQPCPVTNSGPLSAMVQVQNCGH